MAKQTHSIKIRVSERQKSAYERKAAKADLSVSEWIRRRLAGGSETRQALEFKISVLTHELSVAERDCVKGDRIKARVDFLEQENRDLTKQLAIAFGKIGKAK